MILSVEVGGLLGVTQQLSSFQPEFNTQPHRNLEGDFNPFASPQKNKDGGGGGGDGGGGGGGGDITDQNQHQHQHSDGSLKGSGAGWEGGPQHIQPEQNGLSHNSVSLATNNLQNNLSVVTYSQVSEGAS